MKTVMKKCIKTLKILIIKNNLKSIGIIKDLAMLDINS